MYTFGRCYYDEVFPPTLPHPQIEAPSLPYSSTNPFLVANLKSNVCLMPRFIDLVMKYYQQIKDFPLLLLDKIVHQPIETHEL